MNLCKLYKRLPSDERNKWYDDFRVYFLRNKKDYSSFYDRASSDMQKMFIQYIDVVALNGNLMSTQSQGRIFRSEAASVKRITDNFLTAQFGIREDYIREYYPEALI